MDKTCYTFGKNKMELEQKSVIYYPSSSVRM